MMYLDDFVESIEQIPQDMKHYFSHMRSLDLRVSNTYEINQKRFRQLCRDASSMSSAEIKRTWEDIKKDLTTAVEHADEKVQLSSQSYDIIDRQIRRIDIEIKKFQKDLESSRPGITEGLKDQSLALDPESSSQDNVVSRKRSRDESPGLGNDWKRQSMKKFNSQKSVQKTFAGRTPSVPAIVPPVELSQDPNEPRYCFCRQVSYGEMVGCDNDNCRIEWFHYPCVGIFEPPKGKWYCPECLERDPKLRRKLR